MIASAAREPNWETAGRDVFLCYSVIQYWDIFLCDLNSYKVIKIQRHENKVLVEICMYSTIVCVWIEGDSQKLCTGNLFPTIVVFGGGTAFKIWGLGQ